MKAISHSVAKNFLNEHRTGIIYSLKTLPQGCCFSLSALLRPVECGAYSSGVSRKEKRLKTLRPLASSNEPIEWAVNRNANYYMLPVVK